MNGQRDDRPGSGGYLTFKIRTASNALPVGNAVITVTEAGRDGQILGMLVSDRNGNSDSIRLWAPPRAESLSPGSVRKPFAGYDIRVEAEGYYPSELFGAAVFDSVTSVQQVNLIPYAENTPEPDGTRIYEEAPDPLRGGLTNA
ncbi:MAG: hypothetical protein IKV54_05150 [Clostridia bacterium]|nr:hypothetical protein [Clostridia bacterium]